MYILTYKNQLPVLFLETLLIFSDTSKYITYNRVELPVLCAILSLFCKLLTSNTLKLITFVLFNTAHNPLN